MSKPKGMDDNEFPSLAETIVEGLCTDSAHHKQWWLEVLLFELVGEEQYDILKKEHQWEEGLVP